MPFIADSLDDEDEVLAAIATELGSLIEVVGKDKADCLLAPLEELAAVEESLVREAATASMRAVFDALPAAAAANVAPPLIARLAQAEWFTSRTTVASLFAAAYGNAGSSQEALRQHYAKLSTDSTPMVRRAAAQHFGAFVKVIGAEKFVAELRDAFEALSRDEQDSVRLLAVDNCVQVASVLSEAQIKEIVWPVIQGCCKDKS